MTARRPDWPRAAPGPPPSSWPLGARAPPGDACDWWGRARSPTPRTLSVPPPPRPEEEVLSAGTATTAHFSRGPRLPPPGSSRDPDPVTPGSRPPPPRPKTPTPPSPHPGTGPSGAVWPSGWSGQESPLSAPGKREKAASPVRGAGALGRSSGNSFLRGFRGNAEESGCLPKPKHVPPTRPILWGGKTKVKYVHRL